MTLQEIATIISGWNLPFAYYEFEDAGAGPAVPYVVYWVDESDDFYADNINYQKNRKLYIELYCSSKKQAMTWENTIETSLTSEEMAFAKENDYISDERLYVTIYTMEVLQ